MFLALELNVLNALNYLIYFILIITILFGFLRGGKKSIYILIMMVVFFILYFVTLDIAVNFLWTVDLSQFAPQLEQIDPAFTGFTNIEGSLDTFLGVALDGQVDLTNSSTEVIVLATQVGKFVVKLVWTVLYFSAILLLYRIIVWFIGLFLVRNKKGQSKNRGIGAIAGGLNGLIALYIMIIMLGGIQSITESAVVLLDDSSPTPVAQIHELNYDYSFDATESVIPMAEESAPLVPAEMLQYLEDFNTSFENNFLVNIFSNIKATSVIDETTEVPAHINLFDTIFSFDYNESTIALRYEIDVLGQAGLVFLESDYATTNELSDITGNEIRDVFSHLSNSQLITSLAPVAIEIGADMNDITLDISKDDLYAINYDTELANLGSIAGALFDIFNGAGVIGGTGDLSSLTVDGDTVRDIFEDVSESDIILLMTDTILLPMLEDEESDLSSLFTIPDDLDMEAEYLALGSIIGEIIDADIALADIESGDPSILLNSISQVDLVILKNSELVSSALINIFSGEYVVEGLEFIEVPTGIVWEDSGIVDGELTKILRSLNVLTNLSTELDFNDLDISVLDELSATQLDTFFDSYVLRATISGFINDMELTDTPLIFPDVIYDTQNYFTKDELKNIVQAVTLIIDDTTGDIDPLNALNLTSTEIDTLLSSDIIHATIGDMILGYGSTSLIIPNEVVTNVTVDSLAVEVVNKTEVKEIFEALAVLEITDFDTMDFDASIISTLENSTEDDLDLVKISTLLDSKIVHATISNMIVDLGTDNGGILEIPNLDVAGDDLHTVVSTIDYISVSEITNILRALYAIDITDFDTMDFEDTSLLLDNLDELLVSSILQATISKQILDLDGTLTIPETDVLSNDVLIHQGTTTYINGSELSALIDVINLMGISNPTSLDTTLSLTTFATSTNQDILLTSAIMHATVSKTLLDVGSGILIIPTLEEDNTPVRLEVGPLGDETTFIAKQEIKDMLTALDAMDFLDINNFTGAIDPSKFLDNYALVLESASLQATISDIILTSTAVTNDTLLIPDYEVPTGVTAIRITKAVDSVTYISKAELENFIIAVNELGITEFNGFSFDSSDIFAVSNKDNFFNSYIMQATASNYIIDVSGDETSAAGTTALLVPSTKKAAITVDGDPFEHIEKQELIKIFTSLETLGMDNFTDSMDATAISGLTNTQMNTILESASFHLTIDNMIRGNSNVNTFIPSLAETDPIPYDLTTALLTKSQIIEFIEASTVGAGSGFTTTSFNYTTIAGMTPAERDEVLDSMIVRNIVTDQLETMMLADDPGNLYWPSNTYYENNDYNEFLTEAGVNEVLSEYGLI